MSASIGTPRVIGVDSGGCGGADFRLNITSAATAIYRVHLELGGGGVFDASIADSRLPVPGKRLQKRVVSRKLFVVLLQALDRSALDAGGQEMGFVWRGR